MTRAVGAEDLKVHAHSIEGILRAQASDEPYPMGKVDGVHHVAGADLLHEPELRGILSLRAAGGERCGVAVRVGENVFERDVVAEVGKRRRCSSCG